MATQLDLRPTHIDPNHWQEWLDSGVDPDLIALNVRSLSDDRPFDYLCYSSQLDRRNDGRLTDKWMKRYAHMEYGGWWCNGLDPISHEPMMWGCFKPNAPRIDLQRGKTVKYEHPPKTPTRAFFLDVPDRIYRQIAERHQLPFSLAQPFWQWVQAHPEVGVLLVEGVKKAGALLSIGQVAIALPGVFNGRRVLRDDHGKLWSESLIPELALFAVSNRTITFCFDHDTKPATVKNVNLAIAKTGKLLQQATCEVKVISLPGPEKGVDDFIVAQGAASFNQLDSQPLASWQWVLRQRQSLTYPVFWELDVPDLSQAQGDISSLEDLVAIHSGKGTGKTKFVGQLLKGCSKVLLLTHRRCLGRALADSMDLTWKDDADKLRGQWIDPNKEKATQRLALCVDSLLSIDPNHFIGCDLVIDEVCQVLRHLLTSDTCRKDGKRPALLARLHWLVKVARRLIVADADLSDDVLNYLKHLRGECPVYLIQNTFVRVGYAVRFLNCPNHSAITAELMECVESGQKVLIQTDSKEYADAIAAMISSHIASIKVTSDTSSSPDGIDFVRNINTRITSYAVTIATPSLATGVSIEVPHIDKVFGVFFGTFTDADAAQALGRVRSPVPRVVWCAAQGRNFSKVDSTEYPQHLLRSLRQKYDQEVALIRSSLQPDLIPVAENPTDWDSNPHLQLWSREQSSVNTAMWRFRDSLCARLIFEGNQVEVVEVSSNKPFKQQTQQMKASNWQAECVARANARSLTPPERADLEGKEVLGIDDKRAMEKSRLCDFYALPPDSITAELVEFDDRGRKRGQLAKLEMLLYPVLAAKKTSDTIAQQHIWQQRLWIPDIPTSESERIVRVLLGLLPFLVPGRSWSEEDLQPLGDLARTYSRDVKRWLGFTIPSNPDQGNNLWIFRALLAQLGIETDARRQGRSQRRSVWITAQNWDLVQQILQRRQERRDCVVTPSIYI